MWFSDALFIVGSVEGLNIGMEGRRRRKHSLCLYKKKRKLLPHVPSKDPARRLLQMASLATALSSTKVEFSDQLTYPRGLAPESANRAADERGGMQVFYFSVLFLRIMIPTFLQG